MESKLHLTIEITHEQEGSYLTLPFEVPEGIDSIQVAYRYPRRLENAQNVPGGSFTARPKINTIDLGLIDPHGKQAGASGSDKNEVSISETYATPGYTPCPIVAGEWRILVGAYRVAPEGVTVAYEVTLTPKQYRWLRGDLHAHTLASDGVHTLEELALKAKRNGLDFVAVTDHNQFTPAERMPAVEGVTMIPGVEWTHYLGHANFTGVDVPYDEVYATNDPAQISSMFKSGRERGALITINHPFDPNCSFGLDLKTLPFDCIEIWNGPMRELNLRAVGFWQQMLCSGSKIPAVGGSDYHRDTPFIFLGGPTTCVYAGSSGKSDILSAIRAGHCYIVFAPNGPECEMKAGSAIMGDSVIFNEESVLQLSVRGLETGDVVRVVTNAKSEVVFSAPVNGDANLSFRMEAPGFARVEVLRTFLPGVPPLPALITNPIYFD
jgi:hypothetical protein